MADDCVRGMDGQKLENLAITVEIARRSDLLGAAGGGGVLSP